MARDSGRHQRPRPWGRGVAALLLLVLVGAAVAFRPAIHWIAERELSRALDLRVRIDRLQVAPLRGRMRAEGVALRDKSSGRPLLVIPALSIEIVPRALWRQELLVTRLSLERPEVWAALTPEGLAWLPAGGTSGGSRLAVSLREVEVREGRLHLTDRRSAPERQEEVGDLTVRLRSLTTQEERREDRVGLVLGGRWRGMRVSTEGWVTPFARWRAFHLPLQIARADLGQLAAVLPPGLAPEGLAGRADVSLDLGGTEGQGGWQVEVGVQAQVGGIAATPREDVRVTAKRLHLQGKGRWTPKAVVFSQVTLDLAGARIDLPGALQAAVDRLSLSGKADLDQRGLLAPEVQAEMTGFDLGPSAEPPRIRIGRLAARGGTDQRAGTARLELVTLADVRVRASREADGTLDLAGWIPKGAGGDAGRPFSWEVLSLEVERAGVDVADRMREPGTTLSIRDASLRLTGATSDPARAIGFELRASTSVAPSVETHGTWLRSPARVEIQGALQDVDLPALVAWLPASVPVQVSGGQASFTLQADFRSGQDGVSASASAKGQVRGLRLAAGPLESFSAEDLEIAVDRFQGAGPGVVGVAGEAQGRLRGLKTRARLAGPAGSPATEAAADEVQVELDRVRLEPPQTDTRELALQGRAVIRGVQASAESQGLTSFAAREVQVDVGGLSGRSGPQGTELTLGGRLTLLEGEGTTPALAARTWKVIGLRADIAELRTSPLGLHIREVAVEQPEVEIVRAGGGTTLGPGGSDGSASPPVQLDRLVVRNGRVRFRDETVQPTRTADVRQVEGEIGSLRVGADVPALVRLSAAEADGTKIRLAGRLSPTTWAGQVRAEVESLDLLRWRPYLPVLVPRLVRGGTASGALDLSLGRNGQALSVTGAGDVTFAPLELGDVARQISFLLADRAEVRIDRFSLDPLSVSLGAIRLERPWVAVVRERDGSLPVLRLLNELRQPGGAAPAVQGAAPAIAVGSLRLLDGVAEIEDRAIRPPFRERMQDLAVTIEGLTTKGDRKASVTLSGKLGDRSSLGLQGFILPLETSFYVDLEGRIDDFNLPRLNAYTAQVTSYRLEQGKLDSRVRYHIEENRLEGENLFHIDQLALGEQVAPEDRFEALVGVPLAVAVSLLQDPSGEIVLRVPVRGDLTRPEFDLGDAIGSAIKNAVIDLIMAPFRMLGQVFTLGGRIGAIEIAPVLFAPGSWALDDTARAHLKSLAGLLRERPKMKIKLSGGAFVESDEEGLRAAKVEEQIQRLSREPGAKGRDDAVDRLYLRSFGASTGGETREQKLAKLRAVQKVTRREVADLPDARTLCIYDYLGGVEGIDRNRLFLAQGKLYRSAEGGGDWARRVDFSILQP